MVKIDRIKKDLAEMLSVDKGIECIEVRADTLDEALADAAVQFETKVSNLEYEVVERGFNGVLGFAKKPWAIRVYQNPTTVVKSTTQKSRRLQAVRKRRRARRATSSTACTIYTVSLRTSL